MIDYWIVSALFMRCDEKGNMKMVGSGLAVAAQRCKVGYEMRPLCEVSMFAFCFPTFVELQRKLVLFHEFGPY